MNDVVLLTGATGFVGRQTIPFLQKKGYQIHAITTQKKPVQDLGVVWHVCNLFSAEETASLIKKIAPHRLLHFAWITTPGKCLFSPENLIWLEASLRLVRLCVERGTKRVVIAGTCAEYESTPLCTENDNLFNPNTFYGQCKRELYRILEGFSKQIDYELAWGYLFYLYGPHECPNRFLPTVIKGILQKREIPLTEGLQIRDFLHVRDAAEGFVELLDSSVRGCFNIASGKGISIREMVQKVADKIGGNELLKFGQRPPALFDPPELIANVAKLNGNLAWRPSVGLDQGLIEVIEWWKSQ
jgi:nucleoside-diphosphate-sugar epimerase